MSDISTEQPLSFNRLDIIGERTCFYDCGSDIAKDKILYSKKYNKVFSIFINNVQNDTNIQQNINIVPNMLIRALNYNNPNLDIINPLWDNVKIQEVEGLIPVSFSNFVEYKNEIYIMALSCLEEQMNPDSYTDGVDSESYDPNRFYYKTILYKYDNKDNEFKKIDSPDIGKNISSGGDSPVILIPGSMESGDSSVSNRSSSTITITSSSIGICVTCRLGFFVIEDGGITISPTTYSILLVDDAYGSFVDATFRFDGTTETTNICLFSIEQLSDRCLGIINYETTFMVGLNNVPPHEDIQNAIFDANGFTYNVLTRVNNDIICHKRVVNKLVTDTELGDVMSMTTFHGKTNVIEFNDYIIFILMHKTIFEDKQLFKYATEGNKYYIVKKDDPYKIYDNTTSADKVVYTTQPNGTLLIDTERNTLYSLSDTGNDTFDNFDASRYTNLGNVHTIIDPDTAFAQINSIKMSNSDIADLSLTYDPDTHTVTHNYNRIRSFNIENEFYISLDQYNLPIPVICTEGDYSGTHDWDSPISGNRLYKLDRESFILSPVYIDREYYTILNMIETNVHVIIYLQWYDTVNKQFYYDILTRPKKSIPLDKNSTKVQFNR